MRVTFNQRHHGTLPPSRYGTTPDLTSSRGALHGQLASILYNGGPGTIVIFVRLCFVAFFSGLFTGRNRAVRCRRRFSFLTIGS